MAAKMERKQFDKPDETRPFKNGKGKLEVVTVGDHTFGRGVFEPGWRWSEHVKPNSWNAVMPSGARRLRP